MAQGRKPHRLNNPGLTLSLCPTGQSEGLWPFITHTNRHTMTTYSKLTAREAAAFWNRFSIAFERYEISRTDYQQLALEEHRLQRWSEQECNGEIQRDDETGKPIRVFTWDGIERARYAIADKEKGSLKRCEEIAERYGLKFFHQSDPRGAQVYVYRESDLNGSDISSVYPTQAHAIYF